MQKIDGSTIKVNRGDLLSLTLSITLEGGSKYTFKTNDKIVFSIYEKNKMSNNAVFLKEITPAEQGNSVTINLTSEETQIGDLINKPVEYWYEVELNDQYTVIGYDDDGPKLFMLYPEGSKLNE